MRWDRKLLKTTCWSFGLLLRSTRSSVPSAPVMLTTAVAIVVAGTACTREDKNEAIPNVRLGMAPRDVRSRFQPGGEGSWQTAVGAGDDTVLEWTSHDPKSSVAQARFEFHLGMLVAIRAHTNDALAAEQVSATSKTVTLRAPSHEGGTNVTVLARDCPTHKDEADALAIKAAR